jgi:hypothetical protein
MDPKCKCGTKVDSKREINTEVIDGGVGDKGYKIAIIYCERCGQVHGVIPTKDMLKDLVKEAVAEALKDNAAPKEKKK